MYKTVIHTNKRFGKVKSALEDPDFSKVDHEFGRLLTTKQQMRGLQNWLLSGLLFEIYVKRFDFTILVWKTAPFISVNEGGKIKRIK